VVLVGKWNQRQNLKITAMDAAGNHKVQKVENFFVTTNLLIRWYTNPVVLVGSVAFLAAVILGIFLFFFFRIREQEAREEENL
jgi:protein-S-isoprenylcysteine O-methyltransferase Ste14